MTKPNHLFSVKQMNDYIRKNKLNKAPVLLKMNRNDKIKALKKINHFDDIGKPRKTPTYNKPKQKPTTTFTTTRPKSAGRIDVKKPVGSVMKSEKKKEMTIEEIQKEIDKISDKIGELYLEDGKDDEIKKLREKYSDLTKKLKKKKEEKQTKPSNKKDDKELRKSKKFNAKIIKDTFNLINKYRSKIKKSDIDRFTEQTKILRDYMYSYVDNFGLTLLYKDDDNKVKSINISFRVYNDDELKKIRNERKINFSGKQVNLSQFLKEIDSKGYKISPSQKKNIEEDFENPFTVLQSYTEQELANGKLRITPQVKDGRDYSTKMDKKEFEKRDKFSLADIKGRKGYKYGFTDLKPK